MALMFVEGYVCDRFRLPGTSLIFNCALSTKGLFMMDDLNHKL